jgi:hypothetical protein
VVLCCSSNARRVRSPRPCRLAQLCDYFVVNVELQAVPVADKLTEQLQQGGERTADTITANAQTLTQQIIQPEARQLAEQVCCLHSVIVLGHIIWLSSFEHL